MKFTEIKPFRIKILLLIILIIYFVYIFREELFLSSSCSHLYNTDSFQTCALSKTCNVTLLFNSYIAYRKCAIEHSSTDVDYVVFDAVNGLGNRILGLVAVTTYALVTSRVLLINWQPGDNHQAHFEELFLPLSSSEKTSLYSLSRLTSLIKNRWTNEIEWKTKASRIPRDWAFYFDRQILCNDKPSHQSWLTRFGFYVLNIINHHVQWIRTDQYFVPLLTRNEKTKQAFITLFQNGQIFAELAKKLIRPVPKVNSIVEDYNLKNEIITIGVHMRSWSSNMIDHIEPFQKCIEHVIQNISRTNKEDIKLHLYIISNTPKRRRKLQDDISKIYSNLEILNPPVAPKNAAEAEKMQYTLAELLILSKMQYLIITSKSTFGMAAQGLARKGAWIVRQDINSDLCQWEPSSEPEYQMMGSLPADDTCYQRGASLPSIGERTVV